MEYGVVVHEKVKRGSMGFVCGGRLAFDCGRERFRVTVHQRSGCATLAALAAPKTTDSVGDLLIGGPRQLEVAKLASDATRDVRKRRVLRLD